MKYWNEDKVFAQFLVTIPDKAESLKNWLYQAKQGRISAETQRITIIEKLLKQTGTTY
jgi:hypothetical protein